MGTTIKYSFHVNDELIEEIVPQCGLRQGDPISPYLFLICAEAFSCLLNAAEERGETVGVVMFVRRCRVSITYCLWIIHYYSLKLMTGVQNICKMFYLCMKIIRARVQTINKDKSWIMFSRNTREGVKLALMADKLGMIGILACLSAWANQKLRLSIT